MQSRITATVDGDALAVMQPGITATNSTTRAGSLR
jgi:hypothetical protein